MARSAEKSVAYTLFFSFRNCCVSGTKTKTHPDYTEVKQENSIDDVVEEKPDLKKSKGKIQSGRLFPLNRWLLLVARDTVCKY